MGSYFPSHPVLQPLAGHSELLYSQTVNDNGGHTPNNDGERDRTASTGAAVRYCSVRGCATVLPFDYSNKMCETCRSRHRTYASTKRAKRKQEKAMLGAQAGTAWSANGEPADDAPSARAALQTPTDLEPSHAGQSSSSQYGFAAPWNNGALDPQLFQQHTSSELAGALAMPHTPDALHPYSQSKTPQQAPPGTGTSSRPADALSLSPGPSQTVYLPEPSASNPAQTGAAQDTPQVPQPPRSILHPKGVISAKSISEAAAHMDGGLPPRYCSIKGCKTLIPGDSFFKMCEPCRDRYRNYGTTKRQKWKREKEEAVAEMERLREEENRRRAENGLPPLSEPETQLEWENQEGSSISGGSRHAMNSNAPRMCTVSHCREILPGNYEFLRCERHRIQNRHHSKLKRVRDKESKAQALEGWVAAVGAHSHSGMHSSTEEPEDDEDGSLFGDEYTRGVSVDTAFMEQGIPPPARGMRRTNYVCSIKVCHNLLSPSNPWKMCDTCRARDRAARRIKALRDSGIDVEPLPPRTVREKKESKTRKGKKNEENTTGSQSDAGSPDNAMLVFMDPLLPEGHVYPETSMSDPSSAGMGTLSFVLADQEGNITEPPRPPKSVEPAAASTSTLPNDRAPNAKPSQKKRKAKATANAAAAAAESASSGPAQPAPPVVDPLVAQGLNGTAPPMGPPMPADRLPQYPFPYYFPPYALPPYPPPPGAQFSYGAPPPPPPGYPRDTYPPPMYPSYPPYSAYPPPYPYPYPYSRPAALPPAQPPTAAPPALAPAPMPPRLDPTYSTFSARPEDGERYGANAASAEGTSLKYTFSVRTGEQWGTPVHGASEARRKRRQAVQSQESSPPSKRAEVDNAVNGESSTQPAAASASNEGTSDDPAEEPPQTKTPDDSSDRPHCSNKACHRLLAPNLSGTLCDRCKERLKKRAMKVKQRFRLEPRKLAKSGGTAESNVQHEGGDEHNGDTE